MSQRVSFENEYFECQEAEDVAILKLKDGEFNIGMDLGVKESFFALFDTLEASPHIKALLILSTADGLSEEHYSAFLSRVSKREVNLGQDDRMALGSGVLFARAEYGLKQFIMRVRRCGKITAFGLRGNVAPPFLGVALAFDFRFASEDTEISLSINRLGVPPDGALGFFLPRYVGMGKATELLFTDRLISAREACELQLVNAVLPTGDFEQRCVQRARELSVHPPEIIAATKALLHSYSEEELQHYLDEECMIMQRTLAKKH